MLKSTVRCFHSSSVLSKRRVLKPGFGGRRLPPPDIQMGAKIETENTLLPKICGADGGLTMVCWHPEIE